MNTNTESTMLTIDHHTITFFPTFEKAEALAKISQTDDPEWTYTVTHYPRGYVVVMKDEDGNEIGTL